MTSEASTMAIKDNMCMNIRVIEVAGLELMPNLFKDIIEAVFRPHWPQRLLEVICTWMPG